MKTLRLFLFVVLLLIVSCNRVRQRPPVRQLPRPLAPLIVADNGLSGVDRQNFYHLPEGSELFPYAWMKALHTANDQPFLQNPERFGLLPDPNNTARPAHRLDRGESTRRAAG